ncbi:MAG: ABC transporter permease [Thermoplasmata archaeon]
MDYAWQAVRRRPGRSAATALGIGLATSLVLILLALSSGIQTSATRLVAASGIDLLATSPNTSLSSTAFPPVASAHLLPSALRTADPNVASASPWLIASLTFVNTSLARAANASDIPPGWQPAVSGVVGWIPGDNAGIETPTVTSGPGFVSPGDPHFDNGSYRGPSTHEIVVDRALATVLNVTPGELVYAGTGSPSGPAALASWVANGTVFRVVGVSGPFWLIPSALLGFVYLSELQQVVAGGSAPRDDASLVLIHLGDAGNPGRDQSRLAGAFPGLSVFTVGNILGAVNSVVDLYRTFGTLIGLIGVAIATLFTTTILLMSVDDRSQELALLRALGFPRRRIAGYIVEEAILLSAIGLGVGIVLGGVGSFALDRFLSTLVLGLPAGFSFVSFDLGVIALGVVEVLLIGFAAAALPAWRALTLPVAQELRAP